MLKNENKLKRWESRKEIKAPPPLPAYPPWHLRVESTLTMEVMTGCTSCLGLSSDPSNFHRASVFIKRQGWY